MAVWTWAGASRRGLSHALTGERRQDARRVAAAKAGRMLVAVACDGAGSATHGAVGAALAARILAARAHAHFASRLDMPSGGTVSGWFDGVRGVIAGAAADHGLSPSDFATTAVVALSDGMCTTTAHVGDGAILARAAGDDGCGPPGWSALSWPEQGEYVSTTFFVTDAELRLRVAAHAAPVDRLVVMTDGMERLALDLARGTPHAPFLDGLCAPMRPIPGGGCDRALSAALARYLDSAAVNARTDDDKTLIMAALG